MLATACEDATVRVWNPSTGATEQVLSGHTALVRSLAFSADGKRLVSTDAGRKIRVWDLERKPVNCKWTPPSLWKR